MKIIRVFFSAALLASLISGPVLAAGDPEAGKAKSLACGGCHGMDGNSAVADFPKLAGQNERYLVKQIKDIKGDENGPRRSVPVMTAMVANLSDQDIADIAAYYASQSPTLGATDPDLLVPGEKLYRAGDLEDGIAACTACHSPRGKGNGPAGFPSLSGQHPKYVAAQLKAFRSGARNNDGDSRMMRDVAARLTDADIEALSSYVSGLH